MTFNQKNKLLLFLFLLGIVFYFLPVCDLAFNSERLVFGVPASVLWIFASSIYLVILIIVFALIHFLPWAQDLDSLDSKDSK